MITVQTILEYGQDVVHNYNDDADGKIMRAIQSSVNRIVRAHPWQWLRRNVSVAQVEDATLGYVLPTPLVKVIGPLKDSNDVTYLEIDQSQVKNPPSPEGRYYSFQTADPLDKTGTVSIDSESTTLSFTPVLAAGNDYDGEFIRLIDQDGHDCGIHEMASGTALENTYWGDRINGGSFVVRPSTTKRIRFTDGSGDALAATLTVYYWIYPPGIQSKKQELPDIWEDVLKAMIWVELQTDTLDNKQEDVRLSRKAQAQMELDKAKIADGPPKQIFAATRMGTRRSMGWRT